MGGQDLSLKVILQAQDLMSGVVKKGFGAILNLAGPLAPVVKLLGGISLAAIGVGVDATHMAADFQQAMLSNVAHAGLAKSQFDAVSQAVLNMASQVGRSPTQLAEALYPILSSFSDIQNQAAKSSLALQTLKLSFETVAGTTVDGTAVANTAVSVFHALGLATNNASVNAARMSNLFDLMDKSVQDGNMSWDAYRGTIGQVSLAIQGTKISFTEANAALDVMTASGFPSAKKAGTALSNLLTEMVIRQDNVAVKAKKLGLAFNSQAFDGMNLAQRIAYLNKVTGGNQAEVLKLLNGSTAAQKAFNSLSKNTEKYAANLKDLNNAHGALKASFDTAAQGFNFAMSKAKASMDALLIRIGTAFLPVLTSLVNSVGPLISRFGDWITKSGVLQTITGVLQNVVSALPGIINGVVSAIQNVVGWYQKNKDIINTVVVTLALLYIPALIKSGVEAVIAGGKTAVGFVSNVYKAGLAGWEAAGKLVVWTGGLIKAGTQAVISGAKTAASWTANIVKSGAEAVIAGAKTAASWTANIVKAGAEAVAAGAKIAAQFIAKIVQAGVEAVITAGKFVASLIPAIVSMAAEAITAAATAIPGLIAGFIGWATTAGAAAIATLAATWPILAVIAAIGLIIAAIVLLITHWKQVSDFALMIWHHIVQFFQDDVAKPIGSLFDQIGTKIHGALQTAQNAFEGFKSAVLGIWNGIVGGIKGAINWIIDQINGFIKGINGVGIDIGSVHIHPHIPLIPHLQTGGFIEPGQWAIAGDPGPNSELVYGGRTGATVFSHSQSMGMLGGGGGDTYIFNVSGGPNASANDIANLVLAKLNSSYRRSGVMGNPAYGARSS